MSASSAIAVSSAWVSTGLLRKRQCGIEVFTIRIIDCRSPLNRDRGHVAPMFDPQLLQHVETRQLAIQSDNRK